MKWLHPKSDRLDVGLKWPALTAYRAEGHRLVSTERAVDLVERALHGESFTPRL